MRKKVSCDNLFVACPIYEDEFEEEPWVQYESMGSVRHTIVVTPKRVLIYSSTDEDGNVKYYNYKTGEEVEEKSFKSSFYTNSSSTTSLYSGYIHGIFPLPIPSMRESFLRLHERKLKEVGYFIPFNEYMEDKLGFSCSSISLELASSLVRLTNVGSGRPFELSTSTDTAKMQLEKIGYHIEKEKSKIKK